VVKRESKYAKKLHELGFKKTDDENYREGFLRFVALQLGRAPNRHERRRALRIAGKPSFTREPELIPPITRATDEVGQTWEADGHIDLSPLGFIDNVEWAKKTLGIRTPHAYPARKQ